MTESEMRQVAESVGTANFDLLLVGDGSGTSADKPCGYACYAYEPAAEYEPVRCYRASLSHGTNNLAELLPYVHALWHFHTIHTPYFGNRYVSIVSDSELTVRQGQRKYVRNANASIWAAIDWFEVNNYVFDWHHVRRNTNAVSTTCDKIAGQMRLLLA